MLSAVATITILKKTFSFRVFSGASDTAVCVGLLITVRVCVCFIIMTQSAHTHFPIKAEKNV